MSDPLLVVIVNNLKPVYQIKQSLLNNKLSNDEPGQFLDCDLLVRIGIINNLRPMCILSKAFK